MAKIFPGMDPYLENPEVWPEVHASLIVYMRDQLQPLLRPRYVANIQQRVYLEGPDRHVVPDVFVSRANRPAVASGRTALVDAAAPVRVHVPPTQPRETFLTIMLRASGRRIVTVIEIVSPTNKYAGPGRDIYVAKQKEVLASDTNLVEIDLLRFGPHVLAVPEVSAKAIGPYDYLVCINQATNLRADYDLLPLSLRKPLPQIPIPLTGSDPDVLVDLQVLLDRAYESGDYDTELPYDAPCVPRLSAADQKWANECIKKAHQPRRRKPRK